MPDLYVIEMNDHETVISTLPALLGHNGDCLFITTSDDHFVKYVLSQEVNEGGVAEACRAAVKELVSEGVNKVHAYVVTENWPAQCGDADPAEVLSTLRDEFPDAMLLGVPLYATGTPITDADGTPHGTIKTPYLGADLAPAANIDREAVDRACKQARSDVESSYGNVGALGSLYREWLTLLENVHYGAVSVREAVTEPDNLRVLARPLSAVLLRDVTMVQSLGEMAETVQRLWMETARVTTGTIRANALVCCAVRHIVDNDLLRASVILDTAQQSDPDHSLSRLLLPLLLTGNAPEAARSMIQAVDPILKELTQAQ